MRPIALTLLVLAVLFQLACSNGDEGDAGTAGSRIPGDNVFSDQVRALEKAEATEKMVMDAFQRRGRAIDADSR